jgi:hypothetical protein
MAAKHKRQRRDGEEPVRGLHSRTRKLSLSLSLFSKLLLPERNGMEYLTVYYKQQ